MLFLILIPRNEGRGEEEGGDNIFHPFQEEGPNSRVWSWIEWIGEGCLLLLGKIWGRPVFAHPYPPTPVLLS